MADMDIYDAMFDYYEEITNVTLVERDVTKALIRFVSPLLLLLGTVGNICSVLIMAKLCREVLSTCVYLAILAVFDLIVLYIRCGNEWLKNIAAVDLTDRFMKSSTSACKAYLFAFNFAIHMYRWLIVCVAIEGSIAVRRPDKITRMCSLSRAKAIVLLLTVLLVCINIHYFWTFDLIDYSEYEEIYGGDRYLCLSDQGERAVFDVYVKPAMDILVTEVLPLLIVGTCCVLMIVAMCLSSHNTQAYAADEAWRKRYLLYPYALQRLKVCILIICVLFIFFTLPKFILLVVQYLEDRYKLSTEYYRFRAETDLAMAIFSLLEHTLLSMKFYIYFATCQQFRDEFYKLCRGLCQCKDRSAVTHHTHQQERPLLPHTISHDHDKANERIVTLSEINDNHHFNNYEPFLSPHSVTEHTNV